MYDGVRADDGHARLVGAVGRPAGGARHGGAVRRAGGGGPGVRRLAARPRPAGGDAAVLLGDVPVHDVRDVVQLERRDHRRAASRGRSRCSRTRSPAGCCSGFGAWAKFAPLLLVPMFLRAGRRPAAEPVEWAYDARPGRRSCASRAGAQRLRRAAPAGRRRRAVRCSASSPRRCCRVRDARGARRAVGAAHVLDRTFGWQLDRPSPFSVWDWGDYPGFPDLAVPQKLLKAGLVLFALGLYLVPRRLDPVRSRRSPARC